MTRLAALFGLVCLPGVCAQSELATLLKGVEQHYNRAKTLEVVFNESYAGQGRPRQNEAGRLVLRKPGRMRWDYTSPPGKLFVSDGKEVFLYSPGLNRVEHMPLKDSEDMRAPLAFLLGKLDFFKEFRDFSLQMDAGNYFITANAKTDKLPYDKIQMLVTPGYEIRKLIVNGLDHSILTFSFEQEKVNPPVDDSRFKFQVPAGANIVNSETGQ